MFFKGRRKSKEEGFLIRLNWGAEIRARKIAGGAYIAAPMGAYFFGVAPSRDLVGKYVVAFVYEDGTEGVIAQEEIHSITSGGEEVPFGSDEYPGHKDYDPRLAKDPFSRVFDYKRKGNF